MECHVWRVGASIITSFEMQTLNLGDQCFVADDFLVNALEGSTANVESLVIAIPFSFLPRLF